VVVLKRHVMRDTFRHPDIYHHEATNTYHDVNGNEYIYDFSVGDFIIKTTGKPLFTQGYTFKQDALYNDVFNEPTSKALDDRIVGKFSSPPACQCGVMKTHGKMADGLVDIHSDWCDLYKYLKAQERIALDTASKNK
jgi:hypothetical protein